jgi:Flp pilus assembly protein TadG
MKKRSNMQKLLRLVRGQGGAQMVEFSLSAMILVTVLFGFFDWMLGIYAFHYASYAAQEGARFATVRGYTWSKNTTTDCSTSPPPNFTMVYNCTASPTDIQNYVESLATPGINPLGVTIDKTSSYVWPGVTPDGTTAPCTSPQNGNNQGCMVKVTVSYTFNFLPLVKTSALTISATSEKVILQ